MWKEIIDAKYLDGYRMFLIFNDGQRRIFDFSPLIERYPVFKPLEDINLFKTLSLRIRLNGPMAALISHPNTFMIMVLKHNINN